MGKVNIKLEKSNFRNKKNDAKQQNKLEKIKEIKALKQKKKKKIIFIILAILLTGIIATGIVLLIQNIPEDWSISIPQGEQSAEQENTDKTEEEKAKEQEKQRKNAVKVALAKFKELGEDLKEEDIEVLRFRRGDKKYYYISSPNNTVEVSVETNEITKINGIVVE